MEHDTSWRYRIRTTGVAIGCVVALAGVALAEGGGDQGPSAQITVSIDALDWMVGHWRRDGEARSSEELWIPPEGGLMLGVGRTIKDGRAVGFEYLRIEQRDASLVYVASPGGQPPTEFVLARLETERAVFENPQHDFPQRILYWREQGDLCARIEGEINGEPRQIGWCWSRL